MPYFSVIIPTYNRADLVGRAIDSVLAQEFQDFELLVVDDGSTDRTADVLADYERLHPARIKILRQANQGPGAARNRGIRAATGRYLALLDSDDLWFPWTLANYRAAVAAESPVGQGEPSLLFGSTMSFQQESELARVVREGTACDRHDDYLTTCRADFSAPGFVRGSGVAVFRTDLLRSSGGFFEKPMYCEDIDLLFRVGAAPGFVYVRSPIQIALRHHVGGSVGEVRRTYDGTRYVIAKEKAGEYAGGDLRRGNRHWFLCHHIRFVSAVFMDRGETRRSLSLYFRGFWWQVRQKRWRYLVGLPLARFIPRLNPVRGYKRS